MYTYIYISFFLPNINLHVNGVRDALADVVGLGENPRLLDVAHQLVVVHPKGGAVKAKFDMRCIPISQSLPNSLTHTAVAVGPSEQLGTLFIFFKICRAKKFSF